MSDSLRSHGLLCPWDFPGKTTGVLCHFLLQGIFPTQGSNPGLPHCGHALPSKPPGKPISGEAGIQTEVCLIPALELLSSIIMSPNLKNRQNLVCCNQSILKEIIPGCSLEGMMLKLKLQYFGHLMRRADSLEKTLMLGEIRGRRKRE